MKIFSLILVVFVMNASFVLGLNAERILPPSILQNQWFNETIIIVSNEPAQITVMEYLSSRLSTNSSHLKVVSQQEPETIKFRFLYYTLNLTKGETRISNYFRPNALGFVHMFPVEIIYDNNSLNLPGRDVLVKCVPNGLCEAGENFVNCRDCKSEEDKICNGVMDGICDPDCLNGDPDCSSYCGDHSCDESKENPVNCPKDCNGSVVGLDNIRYYNVRLRVNHKKLKAQIHLETGRYFKTKGDVRFILLDKKGNLIRAFNKSYAFNNATVKIPYSAFATKLIVKSNHGDFTFDISNFTDYCGDGRCSDSENQNLCPDCKKNQIWGYVAVGILFLFVIAALLKFKVLH